MSGILPQDDPRTWLLKIQRARLHLRAAEEYGSPTLQARQQETALFKDKAWTGLLEAGWRPEAIKRAIDMVETWSDAEYEAVGLDVHRWWAEEEP